MVGTYTKGKDGLFILSKGAIEFEAEEILRNYSKDSLLKPSRIDVEDIIEKMGIYLQYNFLSLNSEILGAFIFNDGVLEIYNENSVEQRFFKSKTIIIDANIAEKEDKRLRFTYGHELGHYVTQYEAFHVDENQLSLFDSLDYKENAVICKREQLKKIEDHDRKILETKEDWQEWQANYFASCLLIPHKTLKHHLQKYIEEYDPLNPKCMLDDLSTEALNELLKELAEIYDVTVEMLKNRLKNLKYLS